MKSVISGSGGVTSREGRVSRNQPGICPVVAVYVTSREGRVSRNGKLKDIFMQGFVTSREGRVSRNIDSEPDEMEEISHVPRGACE